MMVDKEADLRRWLEQYAACYWVENKRGGTPGMPDAICIDQGAPMFVELKMLKAGMTFEASAQQINCMLSLEGDGLLAFVLGAWPRSGKFVIIRPEWCKRIGSTANYGGRAKYVANDGLEFTEADLEKANLLEIALHAYKF
jgi:hypothetical protein